MEMLHFWLSSLHQSGVNRRTGWILWRNQRLGMLFCQSLIQITACPAGWKARDKDHRPAVQFCLGSRFNLQQTKSVARVSLAVGAILLMLPQGDILSTTPFAMCLGFAHLVPFPFLPPFLSRLPPPFLSFRLRFQNVPPKHQTNTCLQVFFFGLSTFGPLRIPCQAPPATGCRLRSPRGGTSCGWPGGTAGPSRLGPGRGFGG